MGTIKEGLPEEKKYLVAITEQVRMATEDRSEKGQITLALLRGQEKMQNIFIDVGEAIDSGLLKRYSQSNPMEYDGTYKGQPVKVSLEEYFIQNRDNTKSVSFENGLEIMLTNPDTREVVQNIYFTRPRNDNREEYRSQPRYSWRADSIDYPKGFKRWDGGGDMPMTQQNEVMGKDGVDGFVQRNGMSEDLHAVVETVDGLLNALTPFKTNPEVVEE